MSEVEATLNSRPLTYDYNIPGEEVLTPANVPGEDSPLFPDLNKLKKTSVVGRGTGM